MTESTPLQQEHTVYTPGQTSESKPSQASTSQVDQAWLQEQIEKASRLERDKLVKQLGYSSFEEAKKSAKEIRELQESQKSELEKLQARAQALDEYKAKSEKYEQALAEYAEDALASLSKEHKKIVISIAGDNPQAQLRTLEQLRKGGLLKTEEVTPVQSEETQTSTSSSATTKMLLTTSVPHTTPKAATKVHESPIERLEQLYRTNPMAAGSYVAENISYIEKFLLSQ